MFNPGSVRQGEQYVPCPPLGELAAMELSVAWVRACLLEGEEGEGVGEITTAQMSMVFHNYFVNLEGRLQTEESCSGKMWGARMPLGSHTYLPGRLYEEDPSQMCYLDKHSSFLWD